MNLGLEMYAPLLLLGPIACDSKAAAPAVEGASGPTTTTTTSTSTRTSDPTQVDLGAPAADQDVDQTAPDDVPVVDKVFQFSGEKVNMLAYAASEFLAASAGFAEEVKALALALQRLMVILGCKVGAAQLEALGMEVSPGVLAKEIMQNQCAGEKVTEYLRLCA